MRAASRTVVITLLWVLALLAVAPVSSALPGSELAQAPSTSAPPAGQEEPATPQDRTRMTIGIVVAVLLTSVVVGRRMRKRMPKA